MLSAWGLSRPAGCYADDDGSTGGAPDAGAAADAADAAAPMPEELLSEAPLNAGPLADWVDPFIGSGGVAFSVGSALPGATAPFGLVKISPDTSGLSGAADWSHCAGYAFGDPRILGFSHTHLHGTGAADYGHVLFLPSLQPEGEVLALAPGHKVAYDHESEQASPGYYSVQLADGVLVELTASPRAAIHRYGFPEDGERLLLIDLSHVLGGANVVESSFDLRPEDGVAEGWLRTEQGWTGRDGGVTVSFSARFEPAFEVETEGAGGSPHATVLRFPGTGEVLARVGVSFVDLDGARNNRVAEADEVGFDELRAATEAAWEAELGRVEVAGGTDDDLTILYTSVYHALQMPTLFTDADGRYRGLDKEVHDAAGITYYTDFSGWDTYRTLHPLMTLVWPEYQLEFLVTLMRMGEQGGTVPRWPLATGYTGSMLGAPMDIIVADSVVKGLDEFDVARMYELLLRTADGKPPAGSRYSGRDCMPDYAELSYCPLGHNGSVAETLENGWADWALGNLAAWLGKDEDAARFHARSQGYRHLVHPETGMLIGRGADGTWGEVPDPIVPRDDYYVEGNAWHYQFLVPWDVDGLAETLGGAEALVDRLDACFAGAREFVTDSEAVGRDPRALPNPYYWHGNEPDIHAPWMYAPLGRPDRAAEVVRWVTDHAYRTTFDGLAGNDDAGTLAAWYLFAAAGFFPLAGSPTYWLASPRFERVVLHHPDGDLEVRAPGVSASRPYVQRAWLGETPLEGPVFDHAALMEAKLLALEMGEAPGW